VISPEQCQTLGKTLPQAFALPICDSVPLRLDPHYGGRFMLI